MTVDMKLAARSGVVLLQLGGPDSAGTVEPFLYSLFSDPDIINFPLSFLVRRPLARLIARKRAPIAAEHYRHIGGRSPINDITARQAVALESNLNNSFQVCVVVAMRYWKPSTSDAIHALLDQNIRRVVLLPLYPQYSITTTGSSLNEWNRAVSAADARFETVIVREYHQHPAYILSIVERIDAALQRFPQNNRSSVHLLFSAHGTPVSVVRKGDPYTNQIESTVKAVMSTGKFSQNHDLSFQSRVGPQKWISPFTTDTVRRLGETGVRNILVIPVAFVSDHIETLYELNVEVRDCAMKNGIIQFEIIEGLNTSSTFIEALAQLARSSIQQLSGVSA
jgi:ferrochelatase